MSHGPSDVIGFEGILGDTPSWHIVCGMGHVGCMHVCPCFSHLKAVADLNDHINVYWLLPVGLKPYSSGGLGGRSPTLWRRTGSISQRASQALRCSPCSVTPYGTRTFCRRATDAKCCCTPWMSSSTFMIK